jgi:hypothetical protein
MPRSIVIDKTIIEQLNRDNKDLPDFYYRSGNGVSAQDIDRTISDDADESVAAIDVRRKLNKGIPVVKLDSRFNPNTWFSEEAAAAMVWAGRQRHREPLPGDSRYRGPQLLSRRSGLSAGAMGQV